MEVVILKLVHHGGEACLGIYFPLDKRLQSLVRSAGARWSKTLTCWYLPYSKKNFENLVHSLSKAGVPFKSLLATEAKSESQPDSQSFLAKETNIKAAISSISKKNLQALLLFRQQLTLKSYSISTIRTYTNEFIRFLKLLRAQPAAELKPNRVKDYLEYCHKELALSESTIHSHMNAIKFYYEQVLKQEKFFWNIPRPKKPLLLPAVFSKEQVARLINAIENAKHKTIIMLTYGCGLRVSEVVSLRVRDVDGQRKVLFIHRAKGKKDRVVSLSPALLIMLREYYKIYRPKDYLFEGQNAGEHLSPRSIQMVLARAKQKAGISQVGGMHALRHSFATHLLDKGIDVVFIQKLLGHNDIKTTLRYLHVTNKDLIQILSPLDDIEGLLKK